MWNALLKILKFLQRIRPVKLKYSIESGRFEAINSNRKIFLDAFNLIGIITWIAALVGLRATFEQSVEITENNGGEQNASTGKMVLRSVLQVLHVGIYSLAVISMWTFRYRLEEGVWMMNQAKSFWEMRVRNFEKSGKAHWKETSLFEFIAYNNLIVVVGAVATLSATPLLSSSTPPHIIFRWIHASRYLGSGITTVACCVYLIVVTTWVAVPILQVLLYICSILYESQFMLRKGYNSKWNLMKELTQSNFRRGRMVHSQSYMFIQAYNSFGYCFFPAAMAAGLIINVVSSFVCIRLSHSLSPTVLASFAAFDIGTLIVTVGLHGFTMISSEECERFLKFWQVRLFGSVNRKWFKACRHIAVKIGPFFFMQRTTLLNTVLEILNLIVSLLMM